MTLSVEVGGEARKLTEAESTGGGTESRRPDARLSSSSSKMNWEATWLARASLSCGDACTMNVGPSPRRTKRRPVAMIQTESMSNLLKRN